MVVASSQGAGAGGRLLMTPLARASKALSLRVKDARAQAKLLHSSSKPWHLQVSAVKQGRWDSGG